METSGFLFSHGCDRAVAWSCSTCGKAICAEHTRMSEAGYSCISCMRLAQQQQAEEREEQKAAQGEDGEVDTTDDPYFYADDDYDSTWDAHDRRAFASSHDTSDDTEADFGAS